MLLWMLACAGPGTGSGAGEAAAETGVAPAGRLLLRDGRLPGSTDPVDVLIEEGLIVAIGPALSGAGAVVEDLGGRTLAPAFIDSHVHLAYLPMAEEMARGGVAAAVDLAAPIEFFAQDTAGLKVIAAGPMITAPGGYPTTSWGRNGYGLECADTAAAVVAADQLLDAGAGVLKVPLTGSALLSDEAIAAVAERAHLRGVKLAVHALGDAVAAQAARLGADVLAHTPTETLSASTLSAWSGRVVVSTLHAFGDSEGARANLGALRGAGAVVLYGTDFGNSRTPGIQAEELEALLGAGLSPAELLAAGTSTPAAFWGLSHLGSLEPGKAASLLVLDADPLADPLTLAAPSAVYLDGVRR
jgi:imidazolonepropionase-like amidohydrolase